MKKTFRISTCIFLIASIASASLFSDTSSTTIEPYTKNEFPTWAHDIRRTEIITFGSLPFVTLWVSVAYSAIVKGQFHNPLDKSTSSYSATDQKRIMQIAAVSCVSLGLTDLTINLIQRGIKGANARRLKKPDAITIIPYGKEPGQSRGNSPPPSDSSQSKEQDSVPPALQIPSDYLQGGIESAIF
jgi:hypothetical protein